MKSAIFLTPPSTGLSGTQFSTLKMLYSTLVKLKNVHSGPYYCCKTTPPTTTTKNNKKPTIKILLIYTFII
jgi:hypothetical protein